jgi:hypothetical protein
LDEIQLKSHQPYLEIGLFVWKNEPDKPIEVLKIKPIFTSGQGLLPVGHSFRIVGEIPDVRADLVTRTLKGIGGKNLQKEFAIQLKRTDKTTQAGIPIFQSKPLEIAPDLSSLTQDGFFRYPGDVSEAPNEKVELEKWMDLNLQEMIDLLFRYIDDLNTARAVIGSDRIQQKMELSTTIALYVAKLQSLTTDLLERRRTLFETVEKEVAVQEENDVIPSPSPMRGARVLNRELSIAEALHFNAELLEVRERATWAREVAWKEYFDNFDQVIEASQKTVLYYMKWLWIDIPNFATGGRVSATMSGLLGASEIAQEEVLKRWKRRIKIIPPPPPDLDLGPGLRPYPQHRNPPRFLAIPQLRQSNQLIETKILIPVVPVGFNFAPQQFPELYELLQTIAAKYPELDWEKGWEIAFKTQSKINELFDAAEMVRDVFNPETKDLTLEEFREQTARKDLPFGPDQRGQATDSFRRRFGLPKMEEGGADIDHIISHGATKAIFGKNANPNFDKNFWPLASAENRGKKADFEKKIIDEIWTGRRLLGLKPEDPLPPELAQEFYDDLRGDIDRFLSRGGSGTLPREVSIGKLSGILLDEFDRWVARQR